MSSTPATALAAQDTLDDARKKVLTSDFFALCYLMLCQLSYTAEDNGQKAVEQITKLLPTMPVPQDTVPGQWRLAWGPVVPKDGSNSNLMYAAEFLDTAVNPAVPVFSSVVIRGTDTEANPAGILKQIIEDLDANIQVPFPDTDPNSKIAQGTKTGFNILRGFIDSSNRTVQQYVSDFLRDNPNAPVVVTGHSLGGCQTTVMGLHLALSFPKAAVVTTSFAAPTAGNNAFIRLYEQKCQFVPRWFNSIDLVPNAYASLGTIEELWNTCGRPAPLLIKIAVEGLKLILEAANVSYSQESDNNSREFTNICQPLGTTAIPAGIQNQDAVEIHAVLQRMLMKIQSTGKLTEVVEKLEGDFRKLPFLQTASHLPFDLFVKVVEKSLSLIEEFSFKSLVAWVEELLYQHLILTGYWNFVQAGKGVAFIPNPFKDKAAAAGVSS